MTGTTPGDGRLTDDEIATAAARQASAVPGVLRLQPGLKHAVGRAARALFATGDEHDQLTAAASGVEVSHRESTRDGANAQPVTEVTLRLITAMDPSPWMIARTVQAAVTNRLGELMGAPVSVIVVIVDVEDVEDMAGIAPPSQT